ncbi:MAG: hypothetical protein PHD54_08870 [Desulfuromonadaceae bacterium]|nr:hypothetical protein [Desulfuromonadaceae bacterium]
MTDSVAANLNTIKMKAFSTLSAGLGGRHSLKSCFSFEPVMAKSQVEWEYLVIGGEYPVRQVICTVG